MTRHPSTSTAAFPAWALDLLPAAAPRPAPPETLGRHFLQAVMSTTQIHRFRYAQGLRVVIEAPTPVWVEPLRYAATTMGDWRVAEVMDGTPGRSRETAAVEERIA